LTSRFLDPVDDTSPFEHIGFGGGCHWCTEAVFQTLLGVVTVEQGFIISHPPSDTYSEAVLVEYNPAEISQSVLIEIHLRTHSSTSNHKMRGKYRSAVYTFSNDQKIQVETTIAELQGGFTEPLVTQTLPFVDFKHSDERFQNYRLKNPEGPFCKSYIDPKLSVLRQQYGKFLNAEHA